MPQDQDDGDGDGGNIYMVGEEGKSEHDSVNMGQRRGIPERCELRDSVFCTQRQLALNEII